MTTFIATTILLQFLLVPQLQLFFPFFLVNNVIDCSLRISYAVFASLPKKTRQSVPGWPLTHRVTMLAILMAWCVLSKINDVWNVLKKLRYNKFVCVTKPMSVWFQGTTLQTANRQQPLSYASVILVLSHDFTTFRYGLWLNFSLDSLTVMRYDAPNSSHCVKYMIYSHVHCWRLVLPIHELLIVQCT